MVAADEGDCDQGNQEHRHEDPGLLKKSKCLEGTLKRLAARIIEVACESGDLITREMDLESAVEVLPQNRVASAISKHPIRTRLKLALAHFRRPKVSERETLLGQEGV